MNTTTISFKHQQGSTLIEILVSMFILALGLMALIAMQTRTSIGIREAENQTRIAQAVENLAENMMTNPALGLSSSTTQRSYAHYTTPSGDCSIGNSANPPAVRSSGQSARLQLAQYHIAAFENEVCNGVAGVDGSYTIKIDNNTTGTTASAGQTLHITWKMGGSSDKEFTYDYPLDDNL